MRRFATTLVHALLVGGLAFTCLMPAAALAQTTFTVTVGAKTPSHPYAGQGWPEAYYINGQESPALSLQRGQTYTFQMSNVDVMHPFYITSAEQGGGQSPWQDGVTGNFATGNATLTFTVPESAPDELWYQCGSHLLMGYRLDITGGTSSEDDALASRFAVTSVRPNPASGAVTLEFDLPVDADVSLAVFDLLGRRVLTSPEGVVASGAARAVTIDVGGLAPGLYIFRVDARAAERELRATGTFIRSR